MPARPLFLMVLIVSVAPPLLGASAPSLLTPDQVRQQLAEGIRLHARGDYDGAIEVYHRILEEDPSQGDALYEMTFSTYAKKDYAGTIELAQRALGPNPKERGGYYVFLGNSQGMLGDWATAEATLRRGLAIWPDDASIRFNLGISLVAQAKLDAAEETFEECLRRSPYDDGGWRALGQTLERQGLRARAFAAYARSLTLSKDPDGSRAIARHVWDLLFEGVSDASTSGPGGAIRVTVPAGPASAGGGSATAASEAMGMSLVAVLRGDDEWKGKSDARFFAYAMDTVLHLLSSLHGSGKEASFWSPFLFSYFDQARASGHMETLAYEVRSLAGDPEALGWRETNHAEVARFREWSSRWAVNWNLAAATDPGTAR